ncbi:MAG: PilZ domain-containing protein [Phycisphaeraceae bacterium]|nr:PilZ domain-containing protein [Phycisphaeraceae bacterium]
MAQQQPPQRRQEFIQHAWQRVLSEAVLRNGRLTLSKSYDGDEAEAPPRFTSRLLAIGPDGTLLVQRPMKRGVARLCRTGSRLDIFMPDGSQWWAGRCTVQGKLRYLLNEDTVVHALRLSPAENVWSAQRRRFFRVDAAGCGLETVHVIPTGSQADEAPLPIGDLDKARGRDAFEAKLFDISGGGMGLRIDGHSQLARWLKPGIRLRCVFRLPGDPRPLDVPALLARIQKVGGGQVHLGISFNFAEAHQRHQFEDRVVHFTTSLQRQQIQRLRGA